MMPSAIHTTKGRQTVQQQERQNESSTPARKNALLTIGKEEMTTESLERPALVRTPEGRWRLYLSCATTGTKHWRVEMTEAAHPAEFGIRDRQTVLPGDAKTGVKDPVIVYHRGLWHLWASCHPLDDPLQTDQMTTEYATSADGVAWTWHGTALSGTPGRWDSRGARVTSVRFDGEDVAGLPPHRLTRKGLNFVPQTDKVRARLQPRTATPSMTRKAPKRASGSMPPMSVQMNMMGTQQPSSPRTGTA